MSSSPPPAYQELMTIDDEPPKLPLNSNVEVNLQTQPAVKHVGTTIIQPVPVIIHQQIGINGSCFKCGAGYPKNYYCTFCGILWFILLFPIGIFCLFCCRGKKCSGCGTKYS